MQDHIHSMLIKQPKDSYIHQSNSNPFLSDCQNQLHTSIDKQKLQLNHRAQSIHCTFYKIPSVILSEYSIQKESSATLLLDRAKDSNCALKSLYTHESIDDSLKHIEILANSLGLYIREQLIQIQQIPLASLSQIDEKKINFHYTQQKTAVIDLDETLISSFNKQKPNTIPISILGSVKYINIRPYTREFIVDISKYYDIIIFTASCKEYANKVIDLIDPFKSISNRIYREHCIITKTHVVKDLRIINRSLKSTVLIDNSIISMSAQLENGIPVKSYFGSGSDSELSKIRDFLIENAHADDIRIKIEEKYKLKQISKFLMDQRCFQV